MVFHSLGTHTDRHTCMYISWTKARQETKSMMASVHAWFKKQIGKFCIYT